MTNIIFNKKRKRMSLDTLFQPKIKNYETSFNVYKGTTFSLTNGSLFIIV